MVKKLKLNLVRNFFRENGIFVFKPFDLQKYFVVSPNTVSLFLSRNVKQGNIIKLRKNYYVFAGEYISEFMLANRIYAPSYVSFEYALMFYGIIPETVYSITSASTKTTREFIVRGVNYTYHHIKRKAFIGYGKKYFDGQMGLVAEPEKALADYLYYVVLGKKSLSDRIDLHAVKIKKLKEYARLFARPKLINLIDQIYDDFKRDR